MNRPQTAQDFLRGKRIWISSSTHAQMAVVEQRRIEILILELCRFIFAAEGTVAYGGDLRKGGTTYLFYEAALRHFPEESARQEAMLHALSEAQYGEYTRRELRDLSLRLRPIGRLALISRYGKLVNVESVRRQSIAQGARSESLTAMRKFLAERCDAQIVVGGFIPEPGRRSGIVEEHHLMRATGKPSFVLGGFGGMARLITESETQHLESENGLVLGFQRGARLAYESATPYMNDAIRFVLKGLRKEFLERDLFS